MAKKPPKQPIKAIEARKNIAPYIIMAIMAGLSVGISATYIFMSQTTPLREELRDTKKKYLELSKENEELKNNNRFQLLNESLVKENANLKNELNKKSIDYEKLKTQLIQITAENKTLSSKINNIYQDYNKLKQRDDESNKYWAKELEKLTRKAKEIPEETLPTKEDIDVKPQNRNVFINSTTGFFNNSVFITLRSLNGKDKITAVVHSSGYREMTIDNEGAGKTFIYNSNKIYEIRIMSIQPNFNNGAATFLVRIK